MGNWRKRPIVWFEEVGIGDAALVGGKGANLGELTQAGIPVPPGFIITIDGQKFCQRLPSKFGEILLAAYTRLGLGPVVVRSSAIGEDGTGAGFAGMHDTFLNIEGIINLLAAINDCWASINNDRAIEYRARNSIGGGDVAMAVVVQRMIDAQHAGVAFTIDPVLGDSNLMVIEAVAGLGERLVSGTVTPDEYILAKRTLTIMSRGGNLMDSASLYTLGALLKRIENHYGKAQDIEWCEVDGEFFIVQSRPVTGG